MNYFDQLNDDIYNFIINNYLNDNDLYKFANIYKIRGIKNIVRLIEYCEENIDLIEWIGDDDEVFGYQKMIDFDNFINVKVLAKKFKLKYFSNKIKKNKELVIEFIKYCPYNFRYAHVKFLDDKDIIMLVVQKYGCIVKHISERLTDNDKILDIAIKNNKYAIMFASERIKAKYADLLQEVNTCSRWSYDDLLKENYYLNKELTDNKYVKMRKSHYEYIEKQKKILLQEELLQKKNEEYIQNLDDKYRKKYGLSESSIIYRNDSMQVISHNDYFDDFYNNHHHYINGYD